MIVIFKAKDGRWAYCPEAVRRWPAFSLEGQFASAQQARDAVARDKTCAGLKVKIETGFFG